MFRSKDVEIMTLPYFEVIRENKSMYEIQSKCTGHYWAIVPLTSRNGLYYQLLHKYREDDNYHFQLDCASVLDAILEIVNHDDFKLKRKSETFENILSKYG